MNALEKYELEELEASEVLKDESHGWKIDSLESADWAFRKIAALKKRIRKSISLPIKNVNVLLNGKQRKRKVTKIALIFLNIN